MIKIKNMSFRYPDLEIFNNVNLEISKGEFVSIIGANGSGKSTLLNLILGFIKPDLGSIEVLGEPIEKFSQFDRIGTIFQGGLTRSQGFPASALEVVMLKSKKMNKEAKKMALDSLDHVGLKDIAHKKISELSGGQLQRVYIARELMYEPDILFLDEPSSGLDSESIKDLMELLDHLNDVHNMTIVMVTHHSNELGHRILEVKEGKVIEMRNEDVRI